SGVSVESDRGAPGSTFFGWDLGRNDHTDEDESRTPRGAFAGRPLSCLRTWAGQRDSVRSARWPRMVRTAPAETATTHTVAIAPSRPTRPAEVDAATWVNSSSSAAGRSSVRVELAAPGGWPAGRREARGGRSARPSGAGGASGLVLRADQPTPGPAPAAVAPPPDPASASSDVPGDGASSGVSPSAGRIRTGSRSAG